MERCNIYIGKKIAEVMAEKKVTKAEMARRLEVRPQSIDYMLSRKSIDTDTLYSVSLALDYDFAQLYSIKKNQSNLENTKELSNNIKKAKVVIELELDKEDILRLNLRKKSFIFIERIKTTHLYRHIRIFLFIKIVLHFPVPPTHLKGKAVYHTLHCPMQKL